jgi:hypothetical protein
MRHRFSPKIAKLSPKELILKSERYVTNFHKYSTNIINLKLNTTYGKVKDNAKFVYSSSQRGGKNSWN